MTDVVYEDYDKDRRWPKVWAHYIADEHHLEEFDALVEARQNAHGEWIPIKVEGYNEFRKIDGKWICKRDRPPYERWYEHAVEDFKRHAPPPGHSLWAIVEDIERILAGKPTVVDYGVDPFTRLGINKICDPVQAWNTKQFEKAWDRDIEEQKLRLVKRLDGTEWLEPDTAKRVMRDAEYRTIQKEYSWGPSDIVQLKYKGRWLETCRCDLAGQCPTGRGWPLESQERWIKKIAYGVVVTADAWYVIDSLTDG